MLSDSPQYWLFKEEPTHYSFDQLVKDGRTAWDGITNSLALKNLRSARMGDLAFFYQSGDVRSVVGIMKVISDPYPDPKLGDGRFVVIDVMPERRLERPVMLNEIKGDQKLSKSDLVRLPRLSVMRVTKETWDGILELARSRI